MIWVLLVILGLSNVTQQQSLANSLFAEEGTSPGFVTRINKKALSIVSDQLKDRVVKFMNSDGLEFNISAPLTNQVRFTLRSSKIISFDELYFDSSMSIVPQKGVSWTGTNINVTLLASFSLLTTQGEITGNVPLSFDKTNVELLLWTGVNGDGHLKTDLITCKVAANNLQLQFSQADSALLANYIPHMQNFIRQTVEQVVCPSFHAELVPVLSNRIMNTPLSASLFEQYFINYALLGPVEFSSQAITLKHRGNSFGILRQGSGRTRLNDFRLPYRSPPLQVPTADSGHMIDFYLSNYTMSSLLFWMDQYRKFDYEISRQATNNSALVGYLKTDCGTGDICAGTLFPALGTRFPGGEVVIKSHTVSYPRVVLRKNNMTIYIDSRVDAFVQQQDRSRRFLTASMNAEVKLDKPSFKDFVLHGELRIDKFKVSDVASLVDGIDEGSLEFLVNALTELILNEDMAKKLKSGIQLPIMFDYTQQAANVSIEDDMLHISADFCATDKCATTADNKDTDVDYYDTVQG
ncbi:Lipid-binding serum glycoprotein C-terminal domain-containing protein [Caenorhabditis elegans]|uniref:Lipid-binding serum glycoprotein C-terminal domain-containing protein n=1 Tax=Caenorhabditis elegans TaxID=6239 RepID=A8WFJ7_CAEEL|nr:Lipid-binding serum glycoprotein C-terminal domain-containing protein [Caenorhabditis elegans]CCD63413.1 Lipid-binding serum glycoprotein C-terminal domain-containing protein [Caenorhabditis elegans]|eukprot:NP_001123098.1 Uncharacterized protein CELE_C06G1.1 [Caenorhabditis elegans]